ncbi:transposable element Tcb1 transposase [Trichonephila clavipes]|uniref:Transposable element Tcb1 transposase n=1 Tax=Trichonephila clavipes TaxID=2585209 RepID=A0A8X6US16_TRICX|nr:transposable element Tcb1 transposase [Trichonephila clavipes]
MKDPFKIESPPVSLESQNFPISVVRSENSGAADDESKNRLKRILRTLPYLPIPVGLLPVPINEKGLQGRRFVSSDEMRPASQALREIMKNGFQKFYERWQKCIVTKGTTLKVDVFRCCELFRKNRSTCWTKLSNSIMWICHRWRQEETMDRQGRSHPPHCTTARENKWIVLMGVIDRAVTFRNIAQQIQSVAHHSMSVLTIRRRLQQSGMSARHPLLRLPLTGNHRCLRRQ